MNHFSPTMPQDFAHWQIFCEEILAQPYPPQSSDFPAETLERDHQLTFSKFSNWEIICQEILDTKFSHIYYQKCYEELLKRGKTEQEILEMRRVAWQTAGWLNYAMMLWDWVSLDETDMLRAVEWLYERKQISQEQQVDFQTFIKYHA